MLLSPRKDGLTSLFKEVRVLKESVGKACPGRCPTGMRQGSAGEARLNLVDVSDLLFFIFCFCSGAGEREEASKEGGRGGRLE